MQEIEIRQYQTGDRSSVFHIAAETAFFGDPVEAFMDDRNLFCDAFVGYYTTHKAEYCWVAETGNEVIGYLLGSTQLVTQSDHWLKYMFSRVIIQAVSGKYRIGRRTIGYALNTVSGYLTGGEPPVDLAEYPAHLHINIDPNFRGFGVGGRLIEAYCKQLHSAGIFGVYLHTTSHNEAACRLYEKLGFQILNSRPNRYWSKWFGFPIENRSYGLKLA
jgi:ribosomal protein S18 acetylase RimI-like enzyme